MIKNVVFDMGNVLLRFDPQIPLDLFCGTQEEKETVRRELFEGPEWIEGDLGNITNEEKYRRIRARIPEHMHSALKRCVYEWDICMEPLPGAKEFCTELKQNGYPIYVLSNASDEFYHYFPRFAPLDFFDGVVVSSDIHMVKPDARIFEYLFRKYRLAPEECLFLDDMERNVAAGRQAGMQGEIFDGDFERIRNAYCL